MKKLLIFILPIFFLFAFASPAKAQFNNCDIGAKVVYNNTGLLYLLPELYPDCDRITAQFLVSPSFINEHTDEFEDWLDLANQNGIDVYIRFDAMGPIGTAEAFMAGQVLAELVNQPGSNIIGVMVNNEPNLIPGYSPEAYAASLIAFFEGYREALASSDPPLDDVLNIYVAAIALGAPSTGPYTQAIATALRTAGITEINIAMTMYIDPETPGGYGQYADLIAQQIANFWQDGEGVAVSNIFITEIGLICGGEPCEELSAGEIGPMLEEMFTALFDVLEPYMDMIDGITASYFYDSDGDGIPDQTWLVLVTFVDGVAQVLVIPFDDLRLGVCAMQYMMDEGGTIDKDAMIAALAAGEEITAEIVCGDDTDCIAYLDGCTLYNYFLEFGEPCTAPLICSGGEEDCAVMIEGHSGTIDGNPCGVPGGHPGTHTRGFEQDEISATARVTEFKVPLVREMAQRIAGTPWSANEAFADGMLLRRLGWWSGLTDFWRPSTSAFNTEREWEVDADGRWVAGRIFGTDRRDEEQGRRGRGGIYVIWRAAKEIEKALSRPGLYDSYAQRTGGLAYKNQNSEFRIQNSESSPYRHPERSEGSPSGNEILRPSTEPVLSEVEGLGAQNDNACVLGESTAAKLPEFETRLTQGGGCSPPNVWYCMTLTPRLVDIGGGQLQVQWNLRFGINHAFVAENPEFESCETTHTGYTIFAYSSSGEELGYSHVIQNLAYGFQDPPTDSDTNYDGVNPFNIPYTPGDAITFRVRIDQAQVTCPVNPQNGDWLEMTCVVGADGQIIAGTCTTGEYQPPQPPPIGAECNAISRELSKYCVNANSYEDISGASGDFTGSATKTWHRKRVCDNPLDPDDCDYEWEDETEITARTEMTPYYSYLGGCSDNVMYTTLGRLDEPDETLERGFFNNFRIPVDPWFDDLGAQIQMNAGITFNACGQGFAAGVRPYTAHLPRLGGIYQTMHAFEEWITPPIDEWEQLWGVWGYPIGKEETLKAKAEEARKTQMSQKIVRNPAPKETFLTKLGSGFGNLLASVVSP